MTDFIMQIAGQVVAANVMFVSTKDYCNSYLFHGDADLSVKTTADDINLEREKCAQTDVLEGISPRKVSDAYLELTAIQRKITEILFDHDVLLFHGSVIAVDGEAYLFTAKSGTGKSTHTRLWREMLGDRAVMVNDDKPFLRFEDGKVYAHGSPWNGKHRLGENICVPLKAICILERGETNQIRQIAPAEALPMLMQQSNRPMDRKNLNKYMELVDAVAASVAFYRLQCNMQPEAAEVSFAAMSG